MMQMSGCPEVNECEALVLAEAITWVRDMGYEQVIFELDSQLVVTATRREDTYSTEFGTIMKHCQHMLQSRPSFKV